MASATLIEVMHKPGITDPVGKGLAHDITQMGLARLKSVASAQLYQIHGSLATNDKTRIARDLLADPILQDYRIENYPSPLSKGKGTCGARAEGLVIDVWYKPGVTDAVGESVMKGIRDLNIPGVKEVRTGMRYHLKGVTRQEIAEKIALALLVNPLVNDSVVSATKTSADLPRT
jgi:phosphoribosylformylglycinamidine (FGAM) synthase PurS component